MSDCCNNENGLTLPVLSGDEAAVERVVLVGKALSDPIRVRMLALMAVGRGCCGLPSVASMPVPGEGEAEGICVCEFQEVYGLGQSKVSYHLRILREAGLVLEEMRGKWTFYSLNRREAGRVLDLVREQLGLGNE
ncbi:MAG TPA: metalloregulator ArsR/SmtB family transcription factor [Symbiobacteriaceae bacterium]|nr:metalloregulator ArsR/SmtB family transcription factor [Symbiobacteriaceae bacterium]